MSRLNDHDQGPASGARRRPGGRGGGAGLRALAALLAVAALGALAAGMVFWTRGSPYRGRMVVQAVRVEVSRGGRSAALRNLEVVDLLEWDDVRTSPEGQASLGWATGAKTVILPDSHVVLGGGAAELELRRGRIRVSAEACAPVSVATGARRLRIVGEEVEVSLDGLKALRGPAEVTPDGGSPLRLAPGEVRGGDGR